MRHLSARAEHIIRLSKEIARDYGLGYVGTEHLLLGIIQEGTGLGAAVLLDHGATEEKIKAEVDRLVRDRMQETWILGRLPGTPHFKDVLARAADLSRGQGNWQIGSLHLLLALLVEKNCVACKSLQALGLTTESVKKSLAHLSAGRAAAALT